MSEDLVLVDTSRPHIRVITMNRPDKRNALNIPLLEAFCRAVDEANQDGDTRVISITGAGPIFCAGLDLTEARDTGKSHRSGALVGKALKAIMNSPHTTIAAARGVAVAGGAGFMLACDLSVVADDFRVGFVEVRRGLVAAFVMTFLRRKVGEPKAREMLLLGELMSAQEAKAAGLVNRVVPADSIMGEAFAFAYTALKGAPMAIRRTKKLFDELYHLPVSEHIDHATEFHKDMRTTEEYKEGLAAYAEKRLPKWDPEAKGKA